MITAVLALAIIFLLAFAVMLFIKSLNPKLSPQDSMKLLMMSLYMILLVMAMGITGSYLQSTGLIS